MTVPNEDLLALQNRIIDLEEKMAMYEINGLQDTFSGSGQQTFGGNTGRLDRYGIQFKSTTTGVGQIFWVPAFEVDPRNTTPLVSIEGYRDDSSSAQYIQATAKYSSTEQSRVFLTSSNVQRSVDLLVNDGSASARVQAITDGTKQYVALEPYVLLGSNTADPTSFANVAGTTLDGWLWYRSDSDVFYVRRGGESTPLNGDGSTLTIASGVITATTTYHLVDTESAAATDDLATINGGTTGQILVIKPLSTSRTIVAKDGTGNLQLAGDFTMDSSQDTLTLIQIGGGSWYELSRSDNGA